MIVNGGLTKKKKKIVQNDKMSIPIKIILNWEY